MFNDYDEHWKFDIKDDITFPNAMYVHPLQQWDVQWIFENMYSDKRVKLLVIFGSSVEFRCNSYSDIDVYIEHEEGYQPSLPYSIMTKPVDILSNFEHWDDPISKQIASRGIVLFDRR